MNDKKWLNVDFKEIPQANISNGDQDAFELFARDLLEALGFKIIKGPARGSDDRKDLIVSELRHGRLGSSEVKYLVSCKHFAHNKQKNKSVGNDQEPDIIGRLRNNGCKGFIGFYSTIASEALTREFEESRRNNPDVFFECQIFDRAKIVDFLHENDKTMVLYKRYFPNSFKQNWSQDIDSNLYARKPTISCVGCGTDIVENMSGQVIKLSENEPLFRYGEYDWDKPIRKDKHIIFSCNTCHNSTLERIDEKYKIWPFEISSTSIESYTNPRFFIDNLMRDCLLIRNHERMHTDESFNVWYKLNRAMFYFVCRPMKKVPEDSIRSHFEKFDL
ncbi:restriction endonuclease [Vibrio vulnificus]